MIKVKMASKLGQVYDDQWGRPAKRLNYMNSSRIEFTKLVKTLIVTKDPGQDLLKVLKAQNGVTYARRSAIFVLNLKRRLQFVYAFFVEKSYELC